MSRPFLLFVLILGLVPACAPRVSEEAVQPPAAEGLWAEFRELCGRDPDMSSFRIEMSINYSGPERQDRILAEVWGNQERPVRMDLKAGMGRIFSRWREGDQEWQAFYPHQNTVYRHEDGQLGAAALGFPTPFDLLETSWFLTGRYALLVPEKYIESRNIGDGVKYFFRPEAEVAAVTLNSEGLPIKIRGQNWTAELKDFDPDKGLALRIDLAMSEEQKGIIRIKDARFRDKPWGKKQLELRLPPETERRYLLGVGGG
ncbi:MAG: hypothetical protein ACLFMP_00145 [Desulfonatronovibrionaceae bacterium]